MLVLFDNGTPWGLNRVLKKRHVVKPARALGWHELTNGTLLTMAERAGFEVFVTPDKKIAYQQNLKGRNIALVVLGNSQWPILRWHVERVAYAVDTATAGSYCLIDVPYAPL